MTTHSNILAGKSETEKLGGLQPWGHKTVGHDLAAKQQDSFLVHISKSVSTMNV